MRAQAIAPAARRRFPAVWATPAVRALTIVVCATTLHATPASASLTITKATWDVIGLDSNNVNTGPNVFPVAAIVCNTGPSPAANLTTAFVWESPNGLINLTGPATVNRGTLSAGSCLHTYYWAAVTRSPAAYGTTRRYRITASAEGGLSTSLPVRQLYVERLIGQNRNTSHTPSGPSTVVVGQTYTFTWVGNTAPQGYEQVTNFIVFDDRIFRVLSAESTYSAGPSPVPGVYNDACRWNDDPASPGYGTCSGTGKAGGDMTMTATVQVIGTGSVTLAGTIYDFSGASYHYNADFGRNALPVTAIPGSADLSITKSNGVSTVGPGSTTSYTVVVQNAGPGAADGAVVIDPAAAGLSKTAVSCTAANGAVCPAPLTAQAIESGIAIPVLPSGGVLTFTVTALVTASSRSVTNTASVAAPPLVIDPNPSNNSASDTDAVATAPAQADLAITKTNFVSSLSPGATTIYTIVVTNKGPGPVTGASVTDAAPEGVTFGAWTCTAAGGAVCPASGSGNLDVTVSLPVDSSVTFHISATVGSSTAGSITNTARVTPPDGTTDPNPDDNVASDIDTIAATPSRADLAITKTNGVSTLAPGSTTTYAIVVANHGPDAVTDATVTDPAPADLTFGGWTCTASPGATCPASGSGSLQASVTLPPGGTASFQITATVRPEASGSVTNTATVTLPPGFLDPVTGNNIATDTDEIENPEQRIGVAKNAGSPRQTGPSSFEIPYTIIVANLGSVPATNVQVADGFDRTFVAGSPVISLAGPPGVSPIGGAVAAQCPLNGSFTGTGSATSLLAGNTTLGPGQGCAILVTVHVAYPSAASIPRDAQLNVAIATTHASPGGAEIARDLSDSGTDPAGTNPGASGDTGGSDDPTPVLLPTSSAPPLDPAATLSAAKSASAAVAEVGDAVTYSIHLRNHAGGGLPALTLEDRLPLGFAYVAGTARLRTGSTVVRLADPAGAATRVLVFAVPEQPAASEAVLLYEVRVSAGAQQGDGMNCARATASDGALSSESCVRVLVSSGVFTQQACVTGKVFVDRSGNALQDAGEPGVPGVALYLEDGTTLLTDAAGAFSYCGVRAGTHVLKVDRSTLPAGARLVPAGSRSARDAASAFLDVTFGEVRRADFVVAAADDAVLAEIARRRAAAQTGATEAEWAGGSPSLPPPREAAAEAPLVATGVLEGIVSLTSVARSSGPAARPGDVFDEELRRFSRSFRDGRGVAAARAALFVQGAAWRGYRLSLSFDSERPDRGVLFRDIQPEAFYPIYGDASRKRFEAQTARRYYARVERGGSSLVFGDLATTCDAPSADLGVYARSLTGVQHRFEKRNVAVSIFATRDTLRQVVDEFGARGTSGPYSVSHPNGVSGSEKVEILTRDRNQPAIIAGVQPLTRFLDYEFEPFTGRLLFRRPIPSMDEQLNPVSVRITYEVDAGGDRHWIGGFDARLRLAPRLEVGGSWAQDRSPLAPYELASVNAALALRGQTSLVIEAARSTATVNTNPFNRLFAQHLTDISGEAEGNAARVELKHQQNGMEARVYAGMSGASFYNPSASLNGGRAESGATASYQLRSGTQVRGELIRSNDRLTGGTRQGGVMAVESKVRRLTFEAGLRHVRESAEAAQGSSAGLLQPFGTTTAPGFGFNSTGQQIDPVTGLPLVGFGASSRLSAGRSAGLGQPVEATTIRARAASSFSSNWSAYLEGEQDVHDATRRMAAAGARYRATDRAQLYLRHELISSLDGLYGLSHGQRSQRTVFGASSAYRSGGELFSEYRLDDAISGREAQAAIGLKNAWKLREGLHLSTGLERLNPIRTAGVAATAASLGAEFTGAAHLKGTSRLEWRREGSNTSWLSTAGLARRLSRDWTMLAKNYYQVTHVSAAAKQLQDRFWVGTAYRDTERNRRSLLSRYEFRLERLPHGSLPGATSDRRVHVVSTHGDYRRSRPWLLSGQYAGKWVGEQLETGPGRHGAHLLSGRTGYDVTSRIDVGALTSVMWSGSDGRLRQALGAEAGVLVWENTWVSLGYNVTGFSDRDFRPLLHGGETTRGFFVRLRIKFDEDLFRGADRR